MVRAILYILFFSIFYYLLRLFLKALFGPGRSTQRDSEPEELVQDPYCLTYLSKRIAIKKRVSGKDVYFCKEECFRNYLEARDTSKI